MLRYCVFVAAFTLLANSMFVPPAFAQRPLDELEKRLEDELPPPAPVEESPDLTPPAAVAPPPSDAAAPVRTPVRNRPYLGLSADNDAKGVKVLEVQKDGPASFAGLRENDVITAINGDPVTDLDSMAKIIDRLKGGDKAVFEVLRDGKVVRLTAIVGEIREEAPEKTPLTPRNPREREEDFSADLTPPQIDAETDDRPDIASRRASLGVTVTNVTEDMRRRYGLTVRRGALITSVKEGGPAELAGVRAGAVVIAVDGVRVDDKDDLITYIASQRPGEEVTLDYYYIGRSVRQKVRLASAAAAPRYADRRRPDRTDGDDEGLSLFGKRPPFFFKVPVDPSKMTRAPLERVERFLDRLGARRTRETDEPEDLRDQVNELQEQVEFLRRRVIELEDELAAEKARK